MADGSKIEWTEATWNPVRVGKKRAGRTLDGCEHNGFPEVTR